VAIMQSSTEWEEPHALLILIHHHQQLICPFLQIPLLVFSDKLTAPSISLGIYFLACTHDMHENETVLNKLLKVIIMAHMYSNALHHIYSQRVCTVWNALQASAPPAWFAIPVALGPSVRPSMHTRGRGPRACRGDEVEED
jgi:hypothetical protein